MGIRILAEPVQRRGVASGFRFRPASPSEGFISGRIDARGIDKATYSRMIFSGEPLFAAGTIELSLTDNAGMLCRREITDQIKLSAHLESPELFKGVTRASYGFFPFGEWEPDLLTKFELPRSRPEFIANVGNAHLISIGLPVEPGFRSNEGPYYLHLDFFGGVGRWTIDLAVPGRSLLPVIDRVNASITNELTFRGI